jgi:UDP-sulfoquinovose synthase
MSQLQSPKKIIVCGGDGFCGWPTSLHLSNLGHEILILDNLSRRNIDNELECNSLTPIQPMSIRLKRWTEVSGGKNIRFIRIDLSEEYDRLLQIIREEHPNTIIHFAEQRSAPYSMKSSHTKRYTVNNNINTTHNILNAIVESRQDIHLVHLGTMGVYGYGTTGSKIPEGYLTVEVPILDSNEKKQIDIYYPPRPGSVYHMTKVLDAQMFEYYNRNDRIRITDLHQGIVWGTNTNETAMHEDLMNRFDYDSDYGTVLNRMLMQASIGHPLTVYGTGGQTRAFIHIRDTVRCIELAVLNPPNRGERVKICNQMVECHRVRDLANLIQRLTGCEVQNIENPRNEASENELIVANDTFIGLGLEPTTLEEGLMEEIRDLARKYGNRCNIESILPCSFWMKNNVE